MTFDFFRIVLYNPIEKWNDGDQKITGDTHRVSLALCLARIHTHIHSHKHPSLSSPPSSPSPPPHTPPLPSPPPPPPPTHTQSLLHLYVSLTSAVIPLAPLKPGTRTLSSATKSKRKSEMLAPGLFNLIVNC